MRHITVAVEYTSYGDFFALRQQYTSSKPVVEKYVTQGYRVEEVGKFRTVMWHRGRRVEIYRILN